MISVDGMPRRTDTPRVLADPGAIAARDGDARVWAPDLRDPYPGLAAAREQPVSRVVVEGLPVWMVIRYEDAKVVLGDPGISHDPANACPQARTLAWTGASAGYRLKRHILQLDPPAHTRVRGLLAKAFTPRRIEALRPRVERVADGLIADLAGAGRADLLERFARPLPVTVIAQLFGIAPADMPDFTRWADIMAGSEQGDQALLAEAHRQVHGMLSELIRQRRHALRRRAASQDDGDSLIDAMVRARDDEGRLDEDELVTNAVLLLAAGYETTATLIANAVHLLLGDPRQRAALAADPALAAGAVEEFLRYESPIKLSPAVGYALADVQVGDIVIRAGDAVMAHLGAANRDPRQFPEPDRLDITRNPCPHLAFGHGRHFCLGAALGRLEAQVALSRLLAAFPDMRPAAPPEQLEWRVSRLIRGLRTLPVDLGPARR
jgi:cytochrome P450